MSESQSVVDVYVGRDITVTLATGVDIYFGKAI